MIRQQISLAKTLPFPNQRITTLIRAADLLWPYQEDRARAVLTEAFKMAKKLEKENEEKGPRTLILRMQYPDQRYVVIRAIAKWDRHWAQEITRRMLRQGDASPTRDSFSDLLTAERLLEAARDLIATDINAATDLAKASLSYPASAGLTRFLYALARVNKRAANDFYYLALHAYAKKPTREFLYLQAYPFGLPNSLAPPVYEGPTNPETNELTLFFRRGIVLAIVHRAKQALEEPSDERDSYRDPNGLEMPPTISLLHALMQLEPYLKGPLLDLLPLVRQARDNLLVSLPIEMQKLLRQSGRQNSIATAKNFDEEIESALKISDVDRREEVIVTTVLNEQSNSLPLEKLIEVIDKIADPNVREHLLDTICFRRAMNVIGARQYEEAEKLVARVKGHEQRAYLYVEIAQTMLNNHEREMYASEVLDQAIEQAKKAGATIFAARVMLTAASLYAKIDLNRSIAVLTDAINCVNRIENPDFVRDGQAKEKVLQRPGRDAYRFRYYMPGLDPQTVIGQMAKKDFDAALAQTNAIADKLQRALSTLALAEVCLQQKQSKG